MRASRSRFLSAFWPALGHRRFPRLRDAHSVGCSRKRVRGRTNPNKSSILDPQFQLYSHFSILIKLELMVEPQSERLRAQIERDIFSLRLKPGERLLECVLAESYGTSRTPVREALRRLSSDGLIHIMPNKGAIVANFGIREVVEQLEVLAELEGACGRLAAKSCTSKDLDAIIAAQESCHKCAERSDAQGYCEADAAFHASIYAASRNRCLVKLAVDASKRLSRYKRLQFDQRDWVGVSLPEHAGIVQAIQEGLAEEAARLLQLHTVNLGGEFRQIAFTVLAVDPPLSTQ
jgi:DNA-binding GntR family transcriptional regulator